jgi:hypothetical protein
MKKVTFSNAVVVYYFENSVDDVNARINPEFRNAMHFRNRIHTIDDAIGHIFNPVFRKYIYIVRMI